MARILFICYENIFMSQIAEAYYNHFTKSDDAHSAGLSSHDDSRLPNTLVALMNEERVVVSGQYVKKVTPEMVEKSNRIYVLCRPCFCPDFVLDSGKAEFWEIIDPSRMTFNKMRTVRDEIKNKVFSLL